MPLPFFRIAQNIDSYIVAILATIVFAGCNVNQDKNNSAASEIDSVTGNADVARYLKSFKGLGALSDSSTAPSPQQMLDSFKTANDLSIDLVLSEPKINQPVEISFDHPGRLWVVQYNQYPYPKGLKIINVDNYLRVTFDKVPQAPPEGIKGADKITFFEDTDGDGTYDKSTDDKAEIGYRLSYTRTMGEIDQPKSVPVLLKLVESSKTSSALREAALEALTHYNIAEIGERVVKSYPLFRADYPDRIAAFNLLATRASWTEGLFKTILGSKRISKDDVPIEIAQRFKLLNDAGIDKTVDYLWPDTRALTSAEKVERMNKISANKIKNISARPASIMPERLLDKMTDQQLRDLFSYISKKD